MWSDSPEEQQTENFGKRDGIIFVIIINQSMLMNGHFSTSLRCIINTMKNKAISRLHDCTGTLIVGTEDTNNIMNLPHIDCFDDLREVDSQKIIKLQDLTKLKSQQIEIKFGPFRENFDLSDVFWLCIDMFNCFTSKIITKRVFLFTDNDDPFKNEEMGRKALMRIGDLFHSSIELILIPFDSLETSFNVEISYKTLIPNLDVKKLKTDTENYIEQLTTRNFCRDCKKSVISSTIFTVSNLKIHVILHKLVQRRSKPTSHRLHRTSGRRLFRNTMYYDSESYQTFNTDETLRFINFVSGDSCVYDKNELVYIPELRLVGFVETHFLKPYYHVTSSYFVYPQLICSDSADFFSLLLRRCHERSKLIVAWHVPHVNQSGRYVVLQPQLEEVCSESGVQIFPSGFHMIILPYRDDIRNCVCESIVTDFCGNELMDTVRRLIGQLTFTYRPENFENPSLRRFYGTLEAMALDLDDVEDFDDITMPNLEEIDARAGEIIKYFGKLAGLSEIGDSEDMVLRSPYKGLERIISLEEMRKIIFDGGIETLTVKSLKAFLNDNNVVHTIKLKNSLIKLVIDYCNNKD